MGWKVSRKEDRAVRLGVSELIARLRAVGIAAEYAGAEAYGCWLDVGGITLHNDGSRSGDPLLWSMRDCLMLAHKAEEAASDKRAADAPAVPEMHESMSLFPMMV